MNSITVREKLLLVGAGVILVATFYFVVRVQPERAQLKALAEEINGLEHTLANSVLPRTNANPDEVKAQLDVTKASLLETQAKLTALMTKRVDDNSNQALEGLMLEILTLASAQGVGIDTSGVYAGSLADFGIAAGKEWARLQSNGEAVHFRPLRSLSVHGDYTQLRRFIKALSELQNAVSVLKFSIKTEASPGPTPKNAEQTRGVRAELVLAL